MELTIYDWAGAPKVVEIPDVPIKEIDVTVITGDEIIDVEFADGTSKSFDSSNDRFIPYFDGSYLVDSKHIEEWINFKTDNMTNISYRRMEHFQELEEEEE